MRPLYTSLLILLSLTSFSQIKFEVRKADKSDIKFDTILIVATGSKVTKAFLESVSVYIINEFSKKGSTANFFYTENNLDNLNVRSDTLNNSHYKAILYLIPRYSEDIQSTVSLKENVINTSAGTLTTKRLSKKNLYSQGFSFQLFKKLDKTIQLWSASVHVNVKPGKAKSEKSLAKKVIKSFRTNGYIN